VDFHIACQRLKDAEEIAKSCEALGFFTKTTKDDTESDGSPFTVWCTKTIMLNHAEITQIEMLLDRLARSLGGFVDGWGTWGGDEAGGGNNRDHQNWAGSPFSDRRTD
jgi:regulator of RNase E activity RraB